MPFAKRRNNVPRMMKLPFYKSDKCHAIHEAYAYESEDFNIRQDAAYCDISSKYWSFCYQSNSNEIQIFFTYDYRDHGRPNREVSKQPLFKLSIGQVGTLWINGRFTSHWGQYYMQHYINIANLQEIEPKAFICTKPTYFVNKLVHLF